MTMSMQYRLDFYIFAFCKANFVSAAMFPEVDKQGNIDRKHNVAQKHVLPSQFFEEARTAKLMFFFVYLVHGVDMVPCSRHAVFCDQPCYYLYFLQVSAQSEPQFANTNLY